MGLGQGGAISLGIEILSGGNLNQDLEAFGKGFVTGATAYAFGWASSFLFTQLGGGVALAPAVNGFVWGFGSGIGGGYAATRYVPDDKKGNEFTLSFASSFLGGYVTGSTVGANVGGSNFISRYYNQINFSLDAIHSEVWE